ncbi:MULTISPECIES: nucleotide exchange factor GrpE [unclassified Fusibacter]|uniref:nucleotide exchange factor GrpE n=1 Tax=unclassified Fusibacter TaxID=2624464 RepID=UPI0010122E3A|nr:MULTISPECIES: nucleotide exchange factor GrpE [unclassified Fusibacter]MCK8058015.1 nucleotide exchange factor GrpE [Fusibacter sp. A2]NPE20597.1 nucleotide exchange factor GrpE [Fusibacter sp. A1]RXV62804.1 nucleotide exchange factor GrpE [Fusibacter sp. A1]
MARNKETDVKDTIAEEAIEDIIHAQEEEILAEAKAEAKEDIGNETAMSEVVKEMEQRFLRLSADFTNYKKRSEKEKSDIYRNANEKLMAELLPVIDNFERALDHSEESSKEAFVDGVTMILRNFMDVLAKEGLKEVEAEGAPFDPNSHHAVISEASQDHDSDTVIAVLQKGYKLNDKVIRPAMVKVAQ